MSKDDFKPFKMFQGQDLKLWIIFKVLNFKSLVKNAFWHFMSFFLLSIFTLFSLLWPQYSSLCLCISRSHLLFVYLPAIRLPFCLIFPLSLWLVCLSPMSLCHSVCMCVPPLPICLSYCISVALSSYDAVSVFVYLSVSFSLSLCFFFLYLLLSHCFY